MSEYCPSNDEEKTDSSEGNQLLLEYKEENIRLKEENEKLKRTLRIITQPSSIKIRDPSKDGPIAQVLLFNNILAQENAEEIKDFFKRISGRSYRNDYVNAPQASALHFVTPKRKSSLKIKRNSKQERKSSKAYVVTNCFQVFSDQFYVDKVGQALPDVNERKFETPSYEKGSLDTLDGEVEVPTDNVNKKRNMRSCFNCGFTDHQLKDCPAPKNFQHISQRRKDFVSTMSPQNASTRYHLEKETDTDDTELYADLKPGNISNDLREALGISRHELPPYIYQMRWHGYPPGHLLEAQVPSSGLNMYSGDKSKNRGGSDDTTIDVNKIIQYPGFNTKLPRNVIDDHDKVGAPPMDERHSYDVMVSYHKHKNELKRKKEHSESSSSKKRAKICEEVDAPIIISADDNQEVDMEMGGDSDVEIVIPDGETIEIMDDKEEGEIVEDDDTPVDVGSSDITEEELNQRKAKILELLQIENNIGIEDNEIVNETDNGQGEIHDTVKELSVSNEDTVQPGQGKCVSVIKSNVQGDDKDKDLVKRENSPITIDLTLESSKVDAVDNKMECDSKDVEIIEENKDTVSGIPDKETIEVDETCNNAVLIDICDNADEKQINADNPSVNIDSPSTQMEKINEESNGNFTALIHKEETVVISDESDSKSPMTSNNEEQQDIVDVEGQSLTHQHASHLKEATEPVESSGDDNAQTDHSQAQLSTQESDVDVAMPTDDQSTQEHTTVPHRSNFAKGITEFGSFYEESSSRGVYKKLKCLLKNSPRRLPKK